eukprot:1354892-Prymnesium_polylepis.1
MVSRGRRGAAAAAARMDGAVGVLRVRGVVGVLEYVVWCCSGAGGARSERGQAERVPRGGCPHTDLMEYARGSHLARRGGHALARSACGRPGTQRKATHSCFAQPRRRCRAHTHLLQARAAVARDHGRLEPCGRRLAAPLVQRAARGEDVERTAHARVPLGVACAVRLRVELIAQAADELHVARVEREQPRPLRERLHHLAGRH